MKIIPEDTVIVHSVDRGKTAPSPSPFVLKLETYLRMAEISYEIDTKKPYGQNGKTPWISLNGTDMADSQIIIDYLNKKFSKNLWGAATNEDKALAMSARIMLEEHFVWGMSHWRFIKGVHTVNQIIGISPFKLQLLKLVLPGRIKKRLNTQGLGRHDYQTMVQLVEADLRTISCLLGEKLFFLGDQPCEVDCAVFGVLAQVVWALPESPYEKLVNDELKNLKRYCLRMREKYWPDWDRCLYKENKRKVTDLNTQK